MSRTHCEIEECESWEKGICNRYDIKLKESVDRLGLYCNDYKKKESPLAAFVRLQGEFMEKQKETFMEIAKESGNIKDDPVNDVRFEYSEYQAIEKLQEAVRFLAEALKEGEATRKNDRLVGALNCAAAAYNMLQFISGRPVTL